MTYGQCTVGNHVYYARFLDLLEETRGEFFRHLNATFLRWQQEHDLIFPVVECRLRYRTPAHYDDLLSVELWLTEARKVRLIFAYRIVNEAGEEVLEAETVHLATSTTEKLKRLPPELIERLRPFVHATASPRVKPPSGTTSSP